MGYLLNLEVACPAAYTIIIKENTLLTNTTTYISVVKPTRCTSVSNYFILE